MLLGMPRGNQSANKSTGSYVKFSHLAKDKLKMRSQEASQFIEGYGRDIPGLGKDLRWLGDPNMPDELQLHNEDAAEFIKRVEKHKAEGIEEDPRDPSTYKRF